MRCAASLARAAKKAGCHAGVASDAVKVAEYRSALRLRSSMLQAGSWSSLEDEVAYKNFSRILSKARRALLHLPSAGAWNHLTLHTGPVDTLASD